MSSEENYNNLLKENQQITDENKINKQDKESIRSTNVDKFNEMIEKATLAISCDSECQKLKIGSELKQRYLDAKTNLVTAPGTVFMTRKNFVIYNGGQTAYDDLIESELKNKAETISAFFIKNFNTDIKTLFTDIKTYAGLSTNLNNVLDLLTKYEFENKMLFKKLKEETNDIMTNQRKTYYQEEGINRLRFYYFYFLVTIYVIFVIAFAIVALKYSPADARKMRLFSIVLFLILPFISTWLLAKIVYFAYQVYEIMPKNIHKEV
jgi:hypothetical protein